MSKSVVSPDLRDQEAGELRALFERHGKGMTHAEFARKSKIGTTGLAWQYLNGHRPLNLPAATKFAEALGIQIDTFSPRLAEEVRAAAPYVRGLTGPGDPDKVTTVHEALQSAEGRRRLALKLRELHEPTAEYEVKVKTGKQGSPARTRPQ